MPDRAALPAALLGAAEAHVARFCELGTDWSVWLREVLGDAAIQADLYRVWSGSEFVARACIRHPESFRQLLDSGDLYRTYAPHEVAERCRAALTAADDPAGREAQLQSQLRRFRRDELVRVIWRDLARLADLQETTQTMSRLADAVMQEALARCYDWTSEVWGTPVGEDSGEAQPLLILAMGKLGADELNVSSDIDLIFAYPEAGETRGAKRSLSNQEFFVRVAQKLIQTLDNATADGRVFRVDMRLRPFGEAGALVLSFDAMEIYYQTQGRDWERYAMTKCRVVGGTPEQAGELSGMLRAFTYRRYVDFSAIQALRDMKAMINAEVKRRSLADDVKLGPGGIREIEFIAQAFQLIRGGPDNRFQNPRIKDILSLLDEEGLLPDRGGARLWYAYVVLRNLEHVLQAWRDEQTQALPAEPAGRERVAVMMGYGGWQEFHEVLDTQRAVVRELFDGLVADASQARAGESPGEEPVSAWTCLDSQERIQVLRSQGYERAEAAADRLRVILESGAVRTMQPEARGRLDRLMPSIIALCAGQGDGTETLSRVVALVESVARRSTYLALLLENRPALEQLVTLCAASPWISQSLASFPLLLDELLDARTLYEPLDRQQLSTELRQLLLRVGVDDLEAQMETLRHFRLAHSLRIAACEVMGVLPLMKVSDYLTWLAEAILEQVLAMAWRHLSEKHGSPTSEDGRVPGFLVVGYGKLGGIELGHGSDLDLVFLHDARSGLSTDGERAIDNEMFFARLGQRIIHILSTATPAGVLYEIDTRLRPSGNSGLLVSSLVAFEKYQQQSAWTWEHQALVRARPVAGDEALAAAFAGVRREVLAREREEADLKRDIIEMRHKMRGHLGTNASEQKEGCFHLKQDRGGIVDIEFMVQFAVLARASKYPELLEWSDNVRLLALLPETGLLSGEEAGRLTEAYIAFRSEGHRLQLQQVSSVIRLDHTLTRHRQAVLASWQHLLGEAVAGEQA